MNEEKNISLLSLLMKNATFEGLTKEENTLVFKMLQEPIYSEDKHCWICESLSLGDGNLRKTIYDTGLCEGHATYAFYTRK